MAKFRFLLLTSGIILGILETWYFYGKNYADDICLTHPLTNMYAWIMMMAIIGCFQQYFNKTNKIMDYVKSRSFYWYVCHYPIMAVIGYILVSVLKLPVMYNYILLLIFDFVITIAFCEIMRLIPVLRYLLFGIKKLKKWGENGLFGFIARH